MSVITLRNPIKFAIIIVLSIPFFYFVFVAGCQTNGLKKETKAAKITPYINVFIKENDKWIL